MPWVVDLGLDDDDGPQGFVVDLGLSDEDADRDDRGEGVANNDDLVGGADSDEELPGEKAAEQPDPFFCVA